MGYGDQVIRLIPLWVTLGIALGLLPAGYFILWATGLDQSLARLIVSGAQYLHRRGQRNRDVYGWPDMLGRDPVLRAYSAVIPARDGVFPLERVLAAYARYPQSKNEGPTNLTIFRVRAWLDDCARNHQDLGLNESHGSVCKEFDDGDFGCPLWLIDIEDHCLVPYSPGMQYMALSYVWGRVDSAQTSAANLASLRQSKSLLGPHAKVSLPRTVRDAMYLTGFLARRYLWCDRLCIVQDDHRTKHAQIEQMAMIYARSYCTIVALDGRDANAGIHGIPNLSRPFRATDVHDGTSDGRSEKGVWQSRGWTFQEELFPVRLIWMSDELVSWQCSSQDRAYHSAGEERIQVRSVPRYSQTRDWQKVGGFLCPDAFSNVYYEDIVKAYSLRIFSNHAPDDRYNAFSGIQRVMETTCREPFLQGIPVRWLSHYLLWTSGNTATKRRRLRYHGSIVPPPSWSWTGWATSIEFPPWTQEGHEPDFGIVTWLHDGENLPQSARVDAASSAVEWPKYPPFMPEGAMPAADAGDPDSRLDPHISAYRDLAILPALAPSLSGAAVICGRVLVASFKLENRDTTHPGLSVLVTGAIPDFAGVLYEKNAKVADGHVLYVLAISRGAYAIATDCGRVPRGHKYYMVAPAGNLKPPLDPLMRKSAKPFIWREYFYDQDDPDAPQFGMKGSDKVRRRKELNDYPEYFVEPQATFTNYYHPALKSLTLDREYFPGSIYEYYSVMWVEWENGIAYRKGLARIAKGVFERECLGWMDVTLG